MALDKLVDSTQLDADLTTVANAIRTRGGTTAQLSFPSGMAQAIADIPGGGGGDIPEAPEKDVNFYGLNAKRLYSYTLAEAQALSALPDLPTDKVNGVPMTYDWVVSLATINGLTSANVPYNVGVAAVPTDGKTHIHIKLEDGRLAPYLGIGVNGSVNIDWGDGTAHSTVTGTNVSTTKYAPHAYASAGKYEIKLTVTGSAQINGGSLPGSFLLSKNGLATESRCYQTAIQAIEVGPNVDIGSYAFAYCSSLGSMTIPSSITDISSYAFDSCSSLGSMTIPNSVTSISSYAFNACYSLGSVTIPSSITSIGTYAFYYCYSLGSMTIPGSVTSIGARAFYNCYSLGSVTIPSSITDINSYVFSACYSLGSVTIPSSITSIGTFAFRDCYGLGYIKFTRSTPPTVSSSAAWSNVPTDCKILVPSGSLSAYTHATNYPSPSTYTYEEY